jgi:hypothetical protein
MVFFVSLCNSCDQLNGAEANAGNVELFFFSFLSNTAQTQMLTARF